MNISTLHPPEKNMSAKSLFKGVKGTALSIHIKEDGILDKHTSPIPALLLCVSGKVLYKDEHGDVNTLSSGDYQNITPDVQHWVKGLSDSQLVLIK